MKEITEREALLRLSALCSQAEHCRYEMEEKLRRWALSDDETARVMDYLTSHKFVDDERYARAFALDKIRYNKWGPRKVEQALWAKHIGEDIRKAVLDGVDDEEYLRVLRPLLKSKRTTLRCDNAYEANTKLLRFAMSRGFTIDLIRQCIDTPDDIGLEEE